MNDNAPLSFLVSYASVRALLLIVPCGLLGCEKIGKDGLDNIAGQIHDVEGQVGRIGTILNNAQLNFNQWSPEEVRKIANELTDNNAKALGDQLNVVARSANLMFEAGLKGTADWALETTKAHLREWSKRLEELRGELRDADTVTKVQAITKALGEVEVLLPPRIDGLAPTPLKLVWDGDHLCSWNKGDVRQNPVVLDIGGNGLMNKDGTEHAFVVSLGDRIVDASFGFQNQYFGQLTIPESAFRADDTVLRIRSATISSVVSSVLLLRVPYTIDDVPPAIQYVNLEKWVQALGDHVGGDDTEFGGNGPKFKLKVSAPKVVKDKKAETWSIAIDVDASAKEVGGNGTVLAHKGPRVLKSFAYEVTLAREFAAYESDPATDDDHDWNGLSSGGVVRQARYMGDTDGNDLGNSAFEIQFEEIPVVKVIHASPCGR